MIFESGALARYASARLPRRTRAHRRDDGLATRPAATLTPALGPPRTDSERKLAPIDRMEVVILHAEWALYRIRRIDSGFLLGARLSRLAGTT